MKRAAGLVIFRKAHNIVQYLLLQTSYGEHHWTPPKGHLDPGETDLVAALRETKEEVGLSKSDLTIYEDSKMELQYPVNGKPKIVIYWLAQISNDKAEVKLSDEHQDMKWLELKAALEYARYKDMQELLKHYDNYIKSQGL